MGVLSDTEQHLSLQLTFQETIQSIVLSIVYARYDALDRLSLWNDLYSVAHNLSLSWIISGEFNVIMSDEENIGGLPVNPMEYEDFAFVLTHVNCLTSNSRQPIYLVE